MSVSGERMEWARKLIVDSTLFFAPPSFFNDPLDCRIPPTFDGSALEIESYWRRSAQESGQRAREYKQRVREMVRLCKTPAGRTQLTGRFFSALNQHGIACFSMDPANMLMWSYYARGHSGIVVRFNMSLDYVVLINRKHFFLDVNYTDDFPTVPYYEEDSVEAKRKILGTKATAWRHEQEWRIVLVGKTGDFRLPRGMVDGVILGLRTPDDVEGKVRDWIREANRPIDLMRVRHRERSFTLEVGPV